MPSQAGHLAKDIGIFQHSRFPDDDRHIDRGGDLLAV
jgi:hypothetical protein